MNVAFRVEQFPALPANFAEIFHVAPRVCDAADAFLQTLNSPLTLPHLERVTSAERCKSVATETQLRRNVALASAQPSQRHQQGEIFVVAMAIGRFSPQPPLEVAGERLPLKSLELDRLSGNYRSRNNIQELVLRPRRGVEHKIGHFVLPVLHPTRNAFGGE